jgi:hypothetical protein
VLTSTIATSPLVITGVLTKDVLMQTATPRLSNLSIQTLEIPAPQRPPSRSVCIETDAKDLRDSSSQVIHNNHVSYTQTEEIHKSVQQQGTQAFDEPIPSHSTSMQTQNVFEHIEEVIYANEQVQTVPVRSKVIFHIDSKRVKVY